MSYATIDDLKLRLSDLFSGIYISIDGKSMDAEAAADLESAAAEINSNIAVRYELPTANTLLKTWNVTLAEELAWGRTGKAEIPKMVVDRVANVRKMLREIANGERLLPDVKEKSKSNSMSFVQIDEPHFTRDKMGGF